MNPSNPLAAEHQDIWELLPWLVNGRLGEADRARTELHLAQCAACRAEAAAQRRLYERMRDDTGVEQLPMAGLKRLRQSLEAHEAGQPSGPGAAPPEPALPFHAPAPRVQRFAVAASVAALAVALAILGGLWRYQRGAPSQAAQYRTVTTTAPEPAGTVVRAVFAPTVTLSELQQVLDDAQLKIVSGPTEAGVYSLAATGARPVAWSLGRLRSHDSVRFAEPTVPSALAAPPP